LRITTTIIITDTSGATITTIITTIGGEPYRR
jgi:hypothetical protein